MQVACFVMVFASIVEYAAVSYIGNLRPPKKKQAGRSSSSSTMARMKAKLTKKKPTTPATSGFVTADGSNCSGCCHQRLSMVQPSNGDNSTSSRPALVIANKEILAATGQLPAAGRMPILMAQSCSDLWRTKLETVIHLRFE
jgi:hypothetical protein